MQCSGARKGGISGRFPEQATHIPTGEERKKPAGTRRGRQESPEAVTWRVAGAGLCGDGVSAGRAGQGGDGRGRLDPQGVQLLTRGDFLGAGSPGSLGGRLQGAACRGLRGPGERPGPPEAGREAYRGLQRRPGSCSDARTWRMLCPGQLCPELTPRRSAARWSPSGKSRQVLLLTRAQHRQVSRRRPVTGGEGRERGPPGGCQRPDLAADLAPRAAGAPRDSACQCRLPGAAVRTMVPTPTGSGAGVPVGSLNAVPEAAPHTEGLRTHPVLWPQQRCSVGGPGRRGQARGTPLQELGSRG